MTTPGEALLRALFGVALNGVLVWGVWGALRRFGPGFDRVVAGVLLAAGTIVLVVTMSGLLGVLDRPPFLLLLTMAAAVLLRSIVGSGDPEATASVPFANPISRHAWPREVTVAATIVLATWIPLLGERLVLPPVAWDALTYHLHFPVLWLQEGTLVTAAAPMGDPSNPYFPLAGEMLLYWILVSTGTDLGASLAQAPLALAAAAIVAWLAVRCGASRPLGAAAGLCWLATPAILRQSVEPMVDVELAAWWLLTIVALTRWSDRARGPWLPLAGVSAGLLIGTKYSGLLYAAALLPLAIPLVRARLRAGRAMGFGEAATAVVLVVAVGGFAYIRNLVNGGNPVLPLEVRVAGHTIAPGIVGADYYFGADAPRLSWRQLFLSARALLDAGPAFLPVLLSLPWAFFSGREPHGLRRGLAASALLAFLAGALLMPYREHRYFFPALGAGWAVLASMVAARGLETVALRGVIVLLVATAPLTLFYWGKDLVLAGPGLGHAAAILIALLAALAIPLRRRLARLVPAAGRALTTHVRLLRNAALAGGLATLALACAVTAYEPTRYESWKRYWGSRYEWERRGEPRPDYRDMGASWKVLADETRERPSVIAYAGTNTPYPMSGPSLENRVEFVPRSTRGRGARYDWGSRPADSREPGDRDSWIANLEATGVRYLCVYGIASRENPEAAFPVEREWADRSPEELRLIWSSEHARIYRRETAAAVLPR